MSEAKTWSASFFQESTPWQAFVAVIAAIRDHLQIEAIYQSFSTPEPRRRHIEPHALVYDSFRWHARARDVEEDRLKDFVLGRLSQIVAAVPAAVDLAEDIEWRRTVELMIAPHPGLGSHQRAAIAGDYGMVGDRLILPVRQAVAYYVKRRLGLLPGHELLAPNDQQIVLLAERPIGGMQLNVEPLLHEAMSCHLSPVAEQSLIGSGYCDVAGLRYHTLRRSILRQPTPETELRGKAPAHPNHLS